MKRVIFLILILLTTRLSHSQPVDKTESGYKQKTFTYKIAGKTPLLADLFLLNENNTQQPAIIWIHGGGLIFGSRKDIPEEQKKYYLSAGYAVLSIDYRLAPETKLSEIVNDIKDAIEWVQLFGADSLKVDPSRLFVIGHSGGAYLALISGYLLKKPPRGIISFYGYGDIQSDWYNKPDSFCLTKPHVNEIEAYKLVHDSAITSASFENRFNIYVYSRQMGIWPKLVAGHNPSKEKQWFKPYCPVLNIGVNYPPTLLIHGDKDSDVPFEESARLSKEMKLNNVKHKFIQVTNRGHVFDVFEGGLSQPDISNVFSEVLKFLDNNR